MLETCATARDTGQIKTKHRADKPEVAERTPIEIPDKPHRSEELVLVELPLVLSDTRELIHIDKEFTE
jgi:hypothetical protein